MSSYFSLFKEHWILWILQTSPGKLRRDEIYWHVDESRHSWKRSVSLRVHKHMRRPRLCRSFWFIQQCSCLHCCSSWLCILKTRIIRHILGPGRWKLRISFLFIETMTLRQSLTQKMFKYELVFILQLWPILVEFVIFFVKSCLPLGCCWCYDVEKKEKTASCLLLYHKDERSWLGFGRQSIWRENQGSGCCWCLVTWIG